MAVAYCARTGEIGIADSLPRGMLAVAYGEKPKLQSAINAHAMIGPDGETPVVPGVPYAANTRSALSAARRFAKKLSVTLKQ